MGELHLNGLKAYHRTIADGCRDQQTDEELIEELTGEFRKALGDTLEAYKKGQGTMFHGVLLVQFNETGAYAAQETQEIE